MARLLGREEEKVSKRRNRILYIGLILVLSLILSSWLVSSYYLHTLYGGSSTDRDGSSISNVNVNILFNYGNGTSRWYNTTVSSGRDFYNITQSLTNNRVESTYYSNLNEHFIQSIDGVRNSGSHYWQLWIYCVGHNGWFYSDWGADLLKITKNNTVKVITPAGPLTLQSNSLAWNYQDQILPPVSGAPQTDTCS